MFPGCYGDGKPKAETCCICGEPTERAGKGEDSIYIEHIGPFCQECWDVINEGVDNVLTARLAEAEARYEALLTTVYGAHELLSVVVDDLAEAAKGGRDE